MAQRGIDTGALITTVFHHPYSRSIKEKQYREGAAKRSYASAIPGGGTDDKLYLNVCHAIYRNRIYLPPPLNYLELDSNRERGSIVVLHEKTKLYAPQD